VECDLVRYENKVEIINGIHSLNLFDENYFRGVHKPSYKDHLSINVACVGMLAWRNQKKAWGLSLVCIFFGKNKKDPSNSRCNALKTKVVSEDMGVSDNSVKTRVAQQYSFASPKTKL
jgi:hypothetical protein